MNRFKITLLLLCFSLSALGQNYNSFSNQKLISSGINRLSGIYTLMNDWDAFTFDGYRWYASANGLSTFQNQNWILMLDGQRMDINFFNLKDINILPYSINLVDSIEIVNHPQIKSGEFTTEGLINLKSIKPGDGLSISGRYSGGNPTGDPGPYLYTEHRSSNVEEDGPDLSAAISYGSENIWGRFLFSTDSFAATDTAMRKRNPQLRWQDFKVRRFSPSLQIGFNLLNGTHNLFLGYSTSEIQPFHPRTYSSNELIYLNPAIKDFPVQMIFKHAGINGNFHFSTSSVINYSVKISSNKIYNASILIDNFEHLKTNYYTSLEYTNWGSMNYHLGIGYDQIKLAANYSPYETSINQFKIYSGVELPLSKDLNQIAGLEILFTESKTALKGYLNSQWQNSPQFLLELNLAAIQTLPEEKSDLWYWIENGYNILERLKINHTFSDERQNEFKITADLNARYNINSSINFATGLIFRNFSNYFVEEVTGIYIPDSSAFETIVNANINSSGNVAGFSLTFKHKILSSLSYTLDYRFLSAVSSDLSFENEWGKIPKNKINCMIIFSPFESFSLWTNATFLSPVSWSYLPNLEDQSRGFYKSKLDERLILDFSVRKWFWNNRLRFNLLFKNLLNNKLQYHPLGAKFNLSVFFSAEIVFSSTIN